MLSSALAPRGDRHATPDTRLAFFQGVRDGMAERPELNGVLVRAGLAELGDTGGEVELGDRRTSGPDAKPRAYVVAVLGSLPTTGVTLREGRLLDETDRAGGPQVAAVSRSFAARHWPGRSAIGQRIRLRGLGEASQWRTVVGVVSDVPLGNPLSRDRSTLAVYVPLSQTDARAASVLFRHRGDLAAASAALRETLAAIDPLLEPPAVATFDEILAKTSMMARSVATLFAGCFAFALLLAVSGTYFPIGRVLAIVTGVLVSGSIIGVVFAATYVPTRRVLDVEPREAIWAE